MEPDLPDWEPPPTTPGDAWVAFAILGILTVVVVPGSVWGIPWGDLTNDGVGGWISLVVFLVFLVPTLVILVGATVVTAVDAWQESASERRAKKDALPKAQLRRS